MTRWFVALALACARSYRRVFAATLVLVGLSALATSRLHLDTDVLHLLPQDDPEVRRFVESIEQFGNVDYLLVAIRIPEGAAVESYQEFAEALGRRLERLPELREVQWGFGDPLEILRAVAPRALLFLDDAGLEKLESRLSAAGLAQRAAEMRRQLATPQGAALRDWFKLDPAGLTEVFLQGGSAARGPLRTDWMSGSYLSLDHRLLLVLARPVRPAQDIAFAQRMVAQVQREVEAERAGWAALTGEDAGPPPEVVLGGGHLIAIGDASVIQKEITFNVVSSLVGVMALFLFAFRRASAAIYPVLPLACGLALTFGFSALALGTLSSATSGVAALLIGLGIDFVIVGYGRYVEARRGGLGVEDAIAEMARGTSPAVAVGALTTAATFFAFRVTSFRGLREMGMLTGSGILFCLLAVLCLLPALLAWSEGRHARRASSPRLFVFGFGADRLVRWCIRKPRATLLGAGALTLLSPGLFHRVGFQEAIEAMRPRGGNQGVAVQQEVGRHFGSGFESMSLLLDGATLDEVAELSQQASIEARRLVERGVLTGYDSMSGVFPPLSRQQAMLSWLRERRAGDLEPARVRARLQSALAQEGLRAEAFAEGLGLLDRALAIDRPLTAEDFATNSGQAALLARHVRQTANGWRAVVSLYPHPRRWKTEAPPEVLASVDRLGPRAHLTGSNVVSAVLRRKVRVESLLAASLGFVGVFALLWVSYRSVRWAAFSLLPLGLGIVWMFGAMGAFGIDMNFMNIFVTTMIVGIGTDYGVHMVHRMIETKDGGGAGLEETAKSVFVAALTTVVGFGSLSLSSYPGLQSMGIVAAFGTLLTCWASLTVLPALWSLRRTRSSAAGRTGADHV
jgi:predicted RND superfamily exporter protein